LKESAEDDCIVALVGNKTDLCGDDDKRPVKYKDGAKLADVYRLFLFLFKKYFVFRRNMDVYFLKVVHDWVHQLFK